jgi:hypothetical protein
MFERRPYRSESKSSCGSERGDRPAHIAAAHAGGAVAATFGQHECRPDKRTQNARLQPLLKCVLRESLGVHVRASQLRRRTQTRRVLAGMDQGP